MSANMFNNIEISRNDFILSEDFLAAPSSSSQSMNNNNHHMISSSSSATTTTASSSQIHCNTSPAIEFNFILNGQQQQQQQQQASAPNSSNNNNNNHEQFNYFACPLNMVDEIEEELIECANKNNDFCMNAPVIKKMNSSFVDYKDANEVSEFTLNREDNHHHASHNIQSNQFLFSLASVDISDFSL